MNIIGILIGLVAAVLVYIVLSSLIVFPHSTIVWALVALVVFCACAFGGLTGRFGRRV